MSIIRRTGLAAAALGVLLGLGAAVKAQDVVFLSTQLRPIEEAQRVRDVLLRGGPRTNFVVEDPARLNVRVEAEQRAGTKSFSVIGALHGELSGLTPLKALDNVDDVMARLAGRGIPQPSPTSASLAARTRSTCPGCRRPTSWPPTSRRCRTCRPGPTSMR